MIIFSGQIWHDIFLFIKYGMIMGSVHKGADSDHG